MRTRKTARVSVPDLRTISGTGRSSRPARVLAWLRELPIGHPWWVVLVVLVTLVPAAILSGGLEVRTSFSELLPQSRPSVVELQRVRGRISGVSTLIVAVEGHDAESLERLIDELSPKIRELGPSFVTGVDQGSRDARGFVEAHKALYADLVDLRSVRDDVVARYDYEVGKRSGLDLGISDEVPPPIDPESIRRRLLGKHHPAQEASSSGYYIGEGGRLAAVVVRTPFEAGDPRAFELERRISDLVEQVNPRAWDATLKVHFTGNLVTSAEEHRAITRDLTHVGATGILLIVAVVFLYFLRVRALAAMVLTIGTGCLWAFAFARLGVGYLNSATGFLVSIIAGNGINFGILLMARYLEARVRDELPAKDAVRTAMTATAGGTLAVALCSSIAYGSLGMTDFRGFRHFGLIAGAGMILCWIASYMLLPALLVLWERVAPLPLDPTSWRSRVRGLFGRPFALLSKKWPRQTVVVAGGTFLIALGLAIHYFAADPLEYDMKRVRNDVLGETSAARIAHRVYPLVGRLTREGRAIVVDRIDQVVPLETILEQRRQAAPASDKPFERVISVFDLLPKDQEEKIAILSQIMDRARRARRLGALSEGDWKKLETEFPGEIRPLRIEDLPKEMAWPFEETDGTRGRLVYLVPTNGRSLDDVHYLMSWADSFREVALPNGDVIRGTGDPVIFADMLSSVRHEAPKAMFLAVVGTLSVIFVAFRGRGTGALAMSSVVLGVTWLVAFLALSRVRINFLNFVALPVSVGVGADYAVNLMKRYEHDGVSHLPRALVETGGALVLCSLTTLLGYGALTLSANGAVRSFGLAGAVGEATALVSAMLVLPAVLFALHHRALRREGGIARSLGREPLFGPPRPR